MRAGGGPVDMKFFLLARFGDSILAPIRAELSAEANLPLWERYTDRQDYPGSAHHSTKAIHLRGPREWTQQGVQFSLDSVNYCYEQMHLPRITNLMNTLFTLLAAKDRGRVMVVALKPQSNIDEHRDEGLYAEHFSRVHLVLSTQAEKDLFYCDDEARLFNEGELWWFNHRLVHSAANVSSTHPRVHLILDFKS